MIAQEAAQCALRRGNYCLRCCNNPQIAREREIPFARVSPRIAECARGPCPRPSPTAETKGHNRILIAATAPCVFRARIYREVR